MAAVVVPFVVGALASKIITKITGSELLGAIAGGFFGGGLNFVPGQGFTWSLQNITGNALTEANIAQGGQELINFTTGTEGLLDASGLALMDAGQGAGAIDLMGAAAQTPTLAENGLLGAAKEAFSPSTLAVNNSSLGAPGGGFLDSLNPLTQETGRNTVVDNTISPAAPVRPSQAASRVGQTQAASASNAGAGGQQPQGVFDRIGGYVEDNPLFSKMMFSGLQSGLADDPADIAREAEEARYQAKARFQSGVGEIDRVTPSLPNTFNNTIRNFRSQNSNIDNIQARYSTMQNPNYRRLLESIRDRYDNEEVA